MMLRGLVVRFIVSMPQAVKTALGCIEIDKLGRDRVGVFQVGVLQPDRKQPGMSLPAMLTRQSSGIAFLFDFTGNGDISAIAVR